MKANFSKQSQVNPMVKLLFLQMAFRSWKKFAQDYDERI